MTFASADVLSVVYGQWYTKSRSFIVDDAEQQPEGEVVPEFEKTDESNPSDTGECARKRAYT
jgi:hypothetical protein